MPLPVLITTAINPPAGVPHLRMVDAARRTVATRAGIFFWAAQKVEHLVIADATGSTCLSPGDVALLNDAGCTVEQIAYHQDDALVQTRGKGYAEGNLIAFALDHSRLLAGAKGLFKCTGKIICRNFPQIARLAEQHGLGQAFWHGSYNGLDMAHIDVRFWLATPDFIRATVLEGYRSADDSAGPMVEAALAPLLAHKLKPVKFTRPRLSGFSGGFDEQYPEQSLGDLDHAFPCLVGAGAP